MVFTQLPKSSCLSYRIWLLVQAQQAQQSQGGRDAGRPPCKAARPQPEGAEKAAPTPPPPRFKRDYRAARPAGGNAQGEKGGRGAAPPYEGGARGEGGAEGEARCANRAPSYRRSFLILILGNCSYCSFSSVILKKWLCSAVSGYFPNYLLEY